MSEWKKYTYCRRGLSHLEEGSVCQDFVELQERGDYTAAALADGIGSLRQSHLAAQTAVAVTNLWLLENAEDILSMSDGEALDALRTGLLPRIRENIRLQAEQTGNQLDQMDCNLAFICFNQHTRACIIGQLGDCAACVIDRDGGSYVLSEWSSSINSTNSVMSSSAGEGLKARVLRLDDGAKVGVILTSDGLENVIYRKNSDLVCKNAEYLFNRMLQPDHKARIDAEIDALVERFAEQLRDDISIAILTLARSPVTLPADPYWLCKCGTKNSLSRSYCRSCDTDILELYGGADYKAAGGRDRYFLRLNKQPEEERRLLERRLGIRMEREQTVEPVQPEPREIPAENHDEIQGRKTFADYNYARADETDTEPAPPRAAPRPERPPKPTGGESFDKLKEGLFGTREERRGPAEARGTVPGKRKGFFSGFKKEAAAEGSGQTGLIDTRENEDPGNGQNRKEKGAAGRRWWVWAAAGLCVLAGLIVFFTLRPDGSDPDGEMTRPPLPQQTDPYEEKSLHELFPDVPYLELSGGTEYFGEHRNGVPDGNGILVCEEHYWIGRFDNGKLDGEFLVANRFAPGYESYTVHCERLSIETLIYADQIDWPDVTDPTKDGEQNQTEPVETTAPPVETTVPPETVDDNSYVVVQAISFIREKPKLSSSTKDVHLPVGTVVYCVDEDGSWMKIEVETDNGVVSGWVKRDSLEKR